MSNAAEAIEQAIELHKAGRPGEATELYTNVLAKEPENADALRLLGIARLQSGDPSAAEDLIRKAISVAPDNAKAHDNLGLLLNATNRHGEAADAFAQAIQLDPSLATAHFNLGKLQVLTQRLDEARQSFQGVLNVEPDHQGARYYLTNTLLQLGEPHAALDSIEALLQVAPADAQGLAFKAVALLEMGDEDAEAALVDFDGLVRIQTIDCPQGFDSLEDFNRDLASYLGSHPGLRDDRSLRNGLLANDVLETDRGSVQALKGLIQQALENHRAALRNAGSHPVAVSCPESFRVRSQGTKLWTGGATAPQIAFNGWLSGVYFAQVPDATAGESQDGWLELGRARPELYKDAQPRVRAIQPQAGLLVTFPAFMWRLIRPFQGEGEHLMVAFEAAPEA